MLYTTSRAPCTAHTPLAGRGGREGIWGTASLMLSAHNPHAKFYLLKGCWMVVGHGVVGLVGVVSCLEGILVGMYECWQNHSSWRTEGC